VVLLHYNARPNVANRTAARLQSFGWEIMEHAPYSPNLAPTRVWTTEEVPGRPEVHFRRRRENYSILHKGKKGKVVPVLN
jgi:hypothetical protein